MKYKGIDVRWLGHSGFLIKGGVSVYIDPFRLGEITEEEKADVILITHPHYDHCSIEDLRKIIKPGTVVVGTSDIQSKMINVGEGINFKIAKLKAGMEIKGVKIETVPSYNINKRFHPRAEEWLGYIIDLDGVRAYHAGDCDIIPEMKSVKADIALLPIGGGFTMSWQEAAAAAEMIKPELAIPMHFGELSGNLTDGARFVEECKKKGVTAVVLERG